MYTDKYENNDVYQIDNNYDDDDNFNDNDDSESKQSFFKKISNFFHNNIGLIIKIVVILICLLLLIWLIISLTGSKKNINSIDDNIKQIRMASEKYYFEKNNTPKKTDEVVTITLNDIYNNSLINKDIKYDNKTCDKNNTVISMKKENKHYVLSINLICDINNKTELFYYDLDTYKCLSCDNSDYDIYEEYDIEISCNKWSDWTTIKIDDDDLEVNKRVLVKGYKDTSTTKTIYGTWSEYTTNVINETDMLEVEKVVKTDDVWSSNKTTTDYIKETDDIKIIDTKINITSGCPSGYRNSSNKCIKTIELGNITMKELYNNQKIGTVSYEKVETSDKGSLIYVNSILTITKNLNSNSTTTTIYQEKIDTINITYYRARIKTIQEIKGEILYTDYMLELNLPAGYQKLENDEKVEYSYKYKVCEK